MYATICETTENLYDISEKGDVFITDKNKEKITDATEVSTTELATILGLSI
ncbi:MAG: hypothetical protein HFE52_06080 [Clostridia bacterium]|nr:hypothetical protein [Clostridia bacterium]